MTNNDYKMIGRLIARLIVECNIPTKKALTIASKALVNYNPFFDLMRFEAFVINNVKKYRKIKEGN